MKQFKYTATRFGSLFLLVCSAIVCMLTLFSCTEEEEFDEKGNRVFSTAFGFTVTHTERVGSVLIMDFSIKNKSGKDIRNFLINPGDAECQGARYSSVDVRLGKEDYASSRRTTFGDGETLTGTFRVRYFDAASSVDKVNIYYSCEAEEANIDSYETHSTNDQKIKDNRVLIDGIQTNDLNLDYQLLKTVQNGSDVYITFSLTNNTGGVLSNFQLVPVEAYDQNGTRYSNTNIVGGNSSDYSWGVTTHINNGASQTYTVKVSYVNTSVSKMSIDIGVTSPSYVIADDKVRFITVPVPFNSGIDDNQDSPVTPTAKQLKNIGGFLKFKYDDNGRLACFGYNGYDDNYIFGYNPFSIMFGRSNAMIDNITIGSNGYVTGIEGAYSAYKTYEQQIEYDNEGHITSWMRKSYDNTVVKVNIVWVNGNVARYEDMTYQSDGTLDSKEIGIPMYSGIENKASQISLSQAYLIGDMLYYGLTGMFGNNCTRLLPDAITVTTYKNGGLEDTTTRTYSYEFNEDGTIYKETENGTPYIYGYY
ncbi:MAG: hypothetical protein ACI4A7_02510 [Prevotella sp.]